MGNLENIPKKEFFIVPEDYFDKLPGQIQSRVVDSKAGASVKPVFRYALLSAIPLLLLAVLLLYAYQSQPDAGSLLASLETADLIAYLQESELTTEEMLENIDLTDDELEALENEIFFLNGHDLEAGFTDLELNAR